MAKAPKKATPQYLENAARYYLERYASSAANLRRVLMRKVERSVYAHDTDRDEGAAAVDAIVERFAQAGLLDDGLYAEGRAVSLNRRGVSVSGIRNRLLAKGVDADTIDRAIETVTDEAGNADLAAALALVRRRGLGPYRLPQQRAERRDKDMAVMARAGFAFDLVTRIIDADSLDDLEAELRDSQQEPTP